MIMVRSQLQNELPESTMTKKSDVVSALGAKECEDVSPQRPYWYDPKAKADNRAPHEALTSLNEAVSQLNKVLNELCKTS